VDTPNQIIQKLSKEDQKLLNKILAVEKKSLHVQKINANSRDEKEIVKEIVNAIDGVLTDAN
jgi:hypothetical protein